MSDTNQNQLLSIKFKLCDNISSYTLDLTNAKDVWLSTIVNWIESIGFTVISSSSTNDDQHTFVLDKKIPVTNFRQLQITTESLLIGVANNRISKSYLLKLAGLALMTYDDIRILDGIVGYMNQLWGQLGKTIMKEVFVKHHKYSRLLVDFFDVKFNPHYDGDRASQTTVIEKSISEYLSSIANINDEKILKLAHIVLQSIVRTNAYQKTTQGTNKEYLSFKIKPQILPNILHPIPFAEIFVSGNQFTAIHLRGDKVARGGIRWSDRDDYRVEVLGLMKAQTTKNAVTVPAGAKGGFKLDLAQTDFENYDQYLQFGISCYKSFLRGVLDITDNIINGEIVRPKDMIIYDQADPYIVAAADKGTAAFSDYANEISAEYNFWLKDAFASGGKTGYDHKKMAITSKGAFISAIRHLEELGINPHVDTFTAVGIGDMSGDVFGNGLLMTNKYKLIAAFNHMHIFIDPNPDPEKSYEERKRLFNLPRSQWSDYSTNVISPGGAIFTRNAKEITLTPEIQAILEIKTDTVTPNDLIKAILTLNVDVIWNGGIGTYIKASTETHSDVNDKTNDDLRCDANQIRAKAIIEGGNLGVTHLGRIEYNKCGGKINADFIDNSGGVDCSDHEVNIKIALNNAVANGKLSIDNRNKLLVGMTKEVENLVLVDNYKQTRAVSISKNSNAYTIDMFSDFIDHLEREGLLNRKEEFLPTKSELHRRLKESETLTRPELAVLLSYGKMHMYNNLIDTTLVTEEYSNKFLFDYFPKAMQEDFADEILKHDLRKEIIATMITNKIINHVGGALIYTLQNETGSLMCDIARAYIVVDELFGIEKLFDKLDILEKVPYNIKVQCFTDLIKVIRRGIWWLMETKSSTLNIEAAIDRYASCIKIVNNIPIGCNHEAKEKIRDKEELYKANCIPADLAEYLAKLEFGISALDIIDVALECKITEDEAIKLYFEVAENLSLDWLRKECDFLMTNSYWQRLSLQIIKGSIYAKQKVLTKQYILFNKSHVEKARYTKYLNIFIEFINYMKLCDKVDTNMLIFANKKLYNLIRKLS